MKNIILSIVAIATISLSSFGQAPEGFKYQAVVRDAGNLILDNQAVGMRLTIQQGSIGGTATYTETFALSTNAYGLVNLEIGTGTTSDDFSTIDWANGPYFIETAVDVTGGTTYAVMGTSQLMSVPYALHAKTAESAINDLVDDADADPINEIQAVSFSNDTLYISNGGQIYLGDYAIDLVDDADADSNNEIQAVSFSNDTLYLSNGGQVYLGDYAIDLVDDADSDPTNELQDWTTLPNIPTDFSDNIDDVDDADADPNNEIQAVSFSNDTLYLSNGGQVYLGDYAIDLVDDADSDPTNELQDWTTLPNIPTDFSDDIDDVDDADSDAANELNTGLSLTGTVLSVDDAGGSQTVDLSAIQDGVDDADSDPTNEIELPTGGLDGQILTVVGGVPTWAYLPCATAVQIGDSYAGGIVFYVDPSGCHGLVSAASDQSPNAPWGCSGTEITGADGTAIGTGNQNTIDIEAGCATAGTAADICANLTLNNFGDWFLPSLDELELMYQNIGPGNALGLGNIGSLTGYYWCSTENSSSGAWEINFADGVPNGYGKGAGNQVRAVRAF